ncbi:hypothetical protein Gotur_029003 [Gossypium turneri]
MCHTKSSLVVMCSRCVWDVPSSSQDLGKFCGVLV